MIKHAITPLIALIGVIPGCDGGSTQPVPEKAPCEGNTVWVHRHDEIPCDVSPPQEINATGLSPLECDNSGGRWYLQLDGQVLCFDLDY